MEVNIEGGLALRHFTRALTCLTRFGEELDFLVTRDRCSISTVNSSRTAFAVVHFYPNFFQSYSLFSSNHPDPDSTTTATFKFSVNGKSLLSPLRPKSSNSIETCQLQIGRERLHGIEPGIVDTGECRIVIRLHCQHGVIKTHRLTYGNHNLNNWARFDKAQCTSSWKASSKILKEWTDHFYLRSGAHAMTDEITFYCSPTLCRLKSFVDTASEQGMSENEIMSTRPLTTELSVDVEDFDLWDVPDFSTVTITFALKEFKAIINLSEALSLPITSSFTQGGKPLMIQVEGDHFESKFVIATTDYDSSSSSLASSVKPSGGGGGGGGVKSENSQSVQRGQGQQQESGEEARRRRGSTSFGRDGAQSETRGRGGGRSGARLFNTPTPSPAPQRQVPVQDGEGQEEEEEDDFDWGGFGFEDADAAFAEIDHLSQVAASSQATTKGGQQQSREAPKRGQGGGGEAGASSGLGFGKDGGKILVKDTSGAVPLTRGGSAAQGTASSSTGEGRKRYEEDEDFGKSPEPFASEETVLGPTQAYLEDPDRPKKKSKWNILDDE